MNGAVCVKERKDFDKKTDSENLLDAKRAVFALDSYTIARLKSVFSGHGNWVAGKAGS